MKLFIDITDNIKFETQAQGVYLPPFGNLEKLEEALWLLLWGFMGGTLVKHIQKVC